MADIAPQSPGVSMPRTAIVLAGGLGTRLRTIVSDRPKVLAPAAGRPFLDYLLRYLSREGIQHVRLSIGYLANQVRDFAGQGNRWGLTISFCEEDTPLGTGGALRLSSHSLEERTFFALNGDTLFLVDLIELWVTHQSLQSAATIALRPVHPQEMTQRGCVTLGKDGKIRSFDEKPEAYLDEDRDILINGGVYLLNQAILEAMPLGVSVSLEREIFPQLASQGLLAGNIQPAYFADIGDPDSLVRFETDLRTGVIPDSAFGS